MLRPHPGANLPHPPSPRSPGSGRLALYKGIIKTGAVRSSTGSESDIVLAQPTAKRQPIPAISKPKNRIALMPGTLPDPRPIGQRKSGARF